MSLPLPTFTRRALTAVFRLGPPLVRFGTYVRPPSFNAATGQMIAAESRAAVQFLGAHINTATLLGLAPLVPGTERLLIRASELSSITLPGRGDFVVENGTGLRRNVEGARLDLSGEFYTFQCVPSLDEDWGDLSEDPAEEDFGALTAATDFEDRMTLV